MYAGCSKASKNSHSTKTVSSTVAWNVCAFILLFSCHHWKDSPLGLRQKHTACWPSVSRTLLLPSNQLVAFYKYTFFLQVNIIYAKKCGCVFLAECIFDKGIFWLFLVTSRDVSAFQLCEYLHEWLIKCQAELEE